MSVFLFTTLLTFATLFLIEISEPAWPARGRTHARLGTYEREGWPRPRIARGWAIVVLAILLLGSAFGLIGVTFRSLYPEVTPLLGWFDAFTGRNAASLLFGIVTGVLLYLFLSKILFNQPGTELKIRDKVILALLIAFLAFGVGGEEAIRGLAQRLTKVSVLGNEVSFSEPGNSKATRGKPDGSPTSASGFAGATDKSHVGWSDSSLGLTDILSAFSQIIERDEGYLQQIESLKKSDKSGAGKGENKAEADLTTSKTLAKLTIDPFGRCLTKVYSETGDTAFVNGRLLELLPGLRLLIVPKQQKPDETQQEVNTAWEKMAAEEAAKDLVRAGDQLAEFVYRSEIAQNVSKSSRSRRAKEVVEECNTLLYLLISDETWPEKMRKMLNDAADDDSSKRFLNWTWDHEGEIRAAYVQDFDTNKERRTLLQNGVKDEFAQFLSSDNNRRRPYVSIIYASVMAQIGRTEAGLVELDRWLQQAKADGRSDWFLVRALSVTTALTEEWLRRPSTSVDSVMHEYQIENLREEIDLIQKLLPVQSFKERYASLPPRRSVEDLVFRDKPADRRPCTAADSGDGGQRQKFKNLQRAYTVVVMSGQQIASHSLLLPEYSLRHSHDVTAIIDEFNKIDLYCLTPPEGSPGLDQMRAESLRLYADAKLHDAQVIATVKGTPAADDALKVSLDAVELGLEIIRPLAEADKSKRNDSDKNHVDSNGESPMLLDRIQSTDNIETYETLLRVKSELVEARRELGE